MNQKAGFADSRRFSVVLFILSLAELIYWITAMSVNVYKIGAISAFFEFFWLPMLLLLVLVPIVSLVFFIRSKFHIRSFAFYSFVIMVITISFIIVNACNSLESISAIIF